MSPWKPRGPPAPAKPTAAKTAPKPATASSAKPGKGGILPAVKVTEEIASRLKANGAQECRNCHHPASMASKEKPHVKDMHKGVIESGQICTD